MSDENKSENDVDPETGQEHDQEAVKTPSNLDIEGTIRRALDLEYKKTLTKASDPNSLGAALDKVEYLLATLGDTEQLQNSITEHIGECKKEISSNNLIRIIASGGAAVTVLVFIATAITHAWWVTKNPNAMPWELSAAIIGFSCTMSTALILVVVRSAFQTFAERNTGVPMPEHIKAFYDMFNEVKTD